MQTIDSVPVVFPETLLDEPLCDGSERDGSDFRWWVLYTKSRQEKAVAKRLLGLEVPFYLPLVKQVSLRRGRKFTSHIPLFAGYVFIHGSETERVRSLTTNRISRVLDVSDGERLREDLRQVHRLIDAECPITVENRLYPGRRVRICSGSLIGLEGTVIVRNSQTRVVVSVDFLQQGTSIEVDHFLLEPID